MGGLAFPIGGRFREAERRRAQLDRDLQRRAINIGDGIAFRKNTTAVLRYGEAIEAVPGGVIVSTLRQPAGEWVEWGQIERITR